MSNRRLVVYGAIALAMLGIATKGVAATQVIGFEGIASLSELEVFGLTFSPNVSLWNGGPLSRARRSRRGSRLTAVWHLCE